VPPLVIGCGNEHRGDDAAGLLVVRRLRELGLRTAEMGGEGVSLLDLWSGAGDVILVDAVLTGAEPGTVFRWDALRERIPRGAFRCSTHHFGVAEAVELGRILDRLPRSLKIYGIEAAQFELGAPPAPAVREAIESLAARIADEVFAGHLGS